MYNTRPTLQATNEAAVVIGNVNPFTIAIAATGA